MKTLAKTSPSILGLVAAAVFVSSTASATTAWADWTSATSGAPGSASGTVDGTTVSYSGEVLFSNTTGNANIWSSPASSFIGGTSTVSPDTPNDAIYLEGLTGTNTITFSKPVVNPVFAIWSLGQPSDPASFTFNATPTFEAGGPDVYGGGPITVSGNVVHGAEGSGVVQFTGTFSSLSWSDTPEYYYAFTVGENGVIASVPEPSSVFLVALGLGFLGFTQRRRSSAGSSRSALIRIVLPGEWRPSRLLRAR